MQFGKYVCTRELGEGEYSRVYAAHVEGESAERYAVKVFSLVPPLSADVAGGAEIGELVAGLTKATEERVALQRQAAQASAHVAPILDSGRAEHAFWSVSPLYPLSLQKLIAKRIHLGREDVLHLMRCVVQALLDLKASGGRSHGNLKLSNVLIGEGQLQAAPIVLTDPLEGQRLEAARFEQADLRAVGELLFQLVRGRETADRADYLTLEAEPTREWKELFGRQAPAWHKLCSRLLDPNYPLHTYSLAQLAQDLQKFQPKPLVSRKALAVTALVLLAGALGGGLYFWLSNRGSLEIEAVFGPGLAAGDLQDRILDRGRGELLSFKPTLAITSKGKTQTLPVPPLKVRRDLPVGPVTVTLTCPGLATNTVNVTIIRGGATNVLFTNHCGVISINSAQDRVVAHLVENAVVSNILQRTAPLRFLASTGHLVLNFALEGHDSSSVPTNLVEGQTVNVPIQLHPTAPGSEPVTVLCSLDNNPRLGDLWEEVTLASNPPMPSLTLPARGFTKEVKLLPGTYTATVRFRPPYKELWGDVSTNFQVPRDRKIMLEVPVGFLEVKPDEPEAVQIEIEEAARPRKRLGSSGELLPLKPGVYTFHFRAEGYDDYSTSKVSVAHAATAIFRNFRLNRSLGTVDLTNNLPVPTARLVTYRTNGVVLTNGHARVRLPPGQHTIVAEFTHSSVAPLANVTQQVKVARAETVSRNFDFSFGTLRLTNLPPSPRLSLDGQTQPATNFFLLPAPRSYDLGVESGEPGYIPYSSNGLLLAKGQQVLVDVALKHADVAVSLASDPLRASVAITDPAGSRVQTAEAGQTVRLPWGPYTFTASHTAFGLDPVIQSRPLAYTNQPYQLTFPFDYSTLVVTSYESGAMVFDSNNRQLGATPFTNSNPPLFKPGTRLSYRLDGIGTEESSNLVVVLRKGLNVAGLVFAQKFVFGLPNDIGLKMVWVPAPAALRGGTWRGKSGTGFWVGQFEVRKIEYDKALKGDWTPAPAPQQGKPGDDLPAFNIGWREATNFCHLLSAHQQDKGALPAPWRFILPDENQWKHFLANGDETSFSVFGKPTFQPVGTLAANSLGLFDVNGNLKEWLLQDTQGNKKLAGCSFDDPIAKDPFNQIFDPGSDAQNQPNLSGQTNYGFRVIAAPVGP